MNTFLKHIFIVVVTFICAVQFCSAENFTSDFVKRISQIDSLWYEDDYDGAIKELSITMPIIVKEYGKNSAQFCAFSLMCAKIYCDNGDFRKALSIVDESIKIAQIRPNQNKAILAQLLSCKGLILINLGKSADSLPFFQDAISILSKEPEYKLEYATSLKDYGIALYDLGNYEMTKKYFEEALSIVNAIDIAPTTFEVVNIELNYANVLSEVGDIDGCISGLKKVIDKLSGCNCHLHLMMGAYGDLAISYIEKEEYAKAVDYANKALLLAKDISSDSDPEIGTFYFYLGWALSGLGKDDEAIESFKQSIYIREKTYGYNHPYTVGAISRLIHVYDRQKDQNNIIPLLVSLTEREKDYFLDQFSKIGPNFQETYWNEFHSSWHLQDMPEFCHKYKDDQLFAITYNGLLLSKGLLLESKVRFMHALMRLDDSSLLHRYNEIVNLKSKMSDADAESVLSEESRLYNEVFRRTDYLAPFKITYRNVAAALEKDDVAIEFMSYPHDGETYYAALVITNSLNFPQFVHLCTSSDITKINTRRYYTSTLLTKLIWEPLLPYINNAENIYFSPSGELYNIAIENLPILDSQNEYMSDRYNIFRLTSTRNIVNRDSSPFIINASLFGDMNYDYGMITNIEINSSNSVDSLNLRDGYGLLPASGVEIENVEEQLRRLNIDVNKFNKEYGTKQAFCNLSGNAPSIIHIATHGFYNQGTEICESSTDALKKSGLLFTGANYAIQHNLVNNTGIVTAEEISNLDFDNLDLATLSACQTGLGEIKGDGVYGLQRGFKLAGAKSLMMSLWKVDDDATRLLMSEFYKNYASGFTKQQSLKLAQQYVRGFNGEINGKVRNFSNPKFWGAFIILDALN